MTHCLKVLNTKAHMYETCKEIDGTTYIVRSAMPSTDDVKIIKNKVKKLILNNVDNEDE